MPRWIRNTLIGLALVGLALHSVPYLVRDQAVLWFYQQGVQQAALKQIKINWLLGEVGVYGLSSQRDGAADLELDRLQVDIDLTALFQKRVLLESLSVTGLRGELRHDGETTWLGPLQLPATNGEEAQPAAADSGSSWQFGLAQVNLRHIDWLTQWQQGRYPLYLNQLQLSDLYQWQPAKLTALQLDGRFDGAELKIESGSYPLKQIPESEFSIQLDQLPLAGLAQPFGIPLSGKLSTDLKVRLTLAGVQVNTEGWLQLDELSYADSAMSTELQQLRWQGEQRWTLADDKRISGDLKGSITAKTLAVTLVEQQLNGQLDQFSWQGKTQLQLDETRQLSLTSAQQLSLSGVGVSKQGLTAELARLEMSAQLEKKAEVVEIKLPQLTLQQLSATQPQYQLISLQALNLTDVHSDLTSAAFKRLQLDGLAVAQAEQQTLSQWQSIAVNQLQWQVQQLAIESVELSGGQTQVVLNEQGVPESVQQFIGRLTSLADTGSIESTSSASEQKEVPAANKPALQVKLAQLRLLKPHKVSFTDYSVEPVFSLETQLKKFSVGPYDTTSDALTEAKLSAQLAQFGELTFSGALDAAQSMQNGHWQAEVKQLELPFSSPYALKYTGYYVHSGQLGLTTEGTIEKGILNGNNHLALFNFEVEPRRQDQVASFSQQLSMPLDTAIMVLEDDDQNIKLDLPVTGSLQDPSFGLQSVVTMLAGKGLKTAAFSYLTKALQPYATLISLATTVIEANEKGSFITLSPVAFQPASTAINSDMRDYLAKISQMMTDRPAMRLKLCGQAVAADKNGVLAALRKANAKRKKPLEEKQLLKELPTRLQTLAQQRGEAVKTRLSASVAADRLFQCYPDVALTGDRASLAPRVDLGL